LNAKIFKKEARNPRTAMPKIHVNGIDLNFETYGQGEPFLLIHGLGSSLRDWEKQVPEFSKRFRVIACDVRGHGSSEKPPGPYSIPAMTEDIVAFVQALKISRMYLLGVSMGGMIAYQLAVRYPQLVKRLVVVNCTPELLIKNFKEQLIMWQRELIVRIIGMHKMGAVLSQRLFIKPEQEEIRQIFVERWSENDPKAYLAAMRALVGWSVADQLHKLTMPVLVIAADEDYDFMGDKAAFLDRTPNAELVIIDDSRHGTPVEHPEEFNKLVLDFLIY